MAEAEHETGGVMNSARRFGRSLLGLAQTRTELFAVELQEEQLRALHRLLWLGVAIAFAAAGLLVGIGTLAWFLWQTAGYAGLAGLAGAALAVAAAIFWGLRRSILRGPPPFAGTVAEFRKDLECLHHRE